MTLEQIEYYIENPIDYDDIRDMSTGLVDLDRITGGLHQGLYAVAGSTSTGKTALALTVAVNVAVSGKRVLFVSPEMSPADLMHRVVCAFAQVDSRVLERGKLNGDELARVHEVLGWASEMDFVVSQEEKIPRIESQVHRALPLDFVALVRIELLQ
jgi:replicative DNA helicase